MFQKLRLCIKTNIWTQYIMHDKNVMYHNVEKKTNLYISQKDEQQKKN